MRHEAEIKSNAYWLGLLAHLQASSVPRKVRSKYLNFDMQSVYSDFFLPSKLGLKFPVLPKSQNFCYIFYCHMILSYCIVMMLIVGSRTYHVSRT
jgi:hypothetical protein